MKKIFIFITVIVVLGSVCLGTHILKSDNNISTQNNKEINEKEVISEDNKEDLEDITKINETENIKVDETPTTDKKDSEVHSDNKNNNNSNNSNNTSSIPVENNNKDQKVESPKEEPIKNKCTPKKFDMTFVRADFDSMSKCTATGDKYKEIGYGYFCDFYQDDCGDTYYMLTLYERDTGIEYDFHNIKLPS